MSLIIRLEIGNISGGSVQISLNDYYFELVGSSAVLYSSGCGIVFDELDVALSEGDKISGNVCFEVGDDETDFDLNHKLSYEDRNYWLSVGSGTDKSE